MTDWLFDKHELLNTPSARDGIDHETENRYRVQGVRLITDVGTELNLKIQDAIATAAVYFHRFYMVHSFKDYKRFPTALGCLFLAGKVEETPKKCRDIIRVAKEKLSVNPAHLEQLGDDATVRDDIMACERVLLQTIHFDLQVEHPYTHLLRYAKICKSDKEKLQTAVQNAWTFINDSLCLTLCLEYEPEVYAIAVLYLACRLVKMDFEWDGRRFKGESWYDQFVQDLPTSMLEDICHQILDLYSPNKATGVAPPMPFGAPQAQTPPAQSPPVTLDSKKTGTPVLPRAPPSASLPNVPPPVLPQQLYAPSVNVMSTMTVPPPPLPVQYQQQPTYAAPANTAYPPPPPPSTYMTMQGYPQVGYGAPPPMYAPPRGYAVQTYAQGFQQYPPPPPPPQY